MTVDPGMKAASNGLMHVHLRAAAAIRRSGTSAAIATASAHVSMSRNSLSCGGSAPSAAVCPCAPRIGRRHPDVGKELCTGCVVQSQQPPAAVGRRSPSTAPTSDRTRASAEVRSSAVTWGVSIPICTAWPAASAWAGEPLGKAGAALLDHRTRPGPWCRGGRAQTPVGELRRSHHVERVEERSRGEVGGCLGRTPVGRCGSWPARDRRLGDQESLHRATRAKSRIVRSVPRTEPDTFDFVPARAKYGTRGPRSTRR